MKKTKETLDKEDLHPYLMCQPGGFMCPDVEHHPMGHLSLAEFPFGENEINTITSILIQYLYFIFSLQNSHGAEEFN